MTYRLKTFRVQFVAEPAEFPTCSPCRSSADVEKARPSFPVRLRIYESWVPKEQEPIPLREHRPSLKPSHQHHQPDYDGNQQEQIRRFPNQHFADVHQKEWLTNEA